MIRFSNFLTEVFDKPVPYTRSAIGDIGTPSYRFVVNHNPYILYFSSTGRKKTPITIVLSYKGNTLKSEFNLTNLGDQYPVLATIKKISIDHFKSFPLLAGDIIEFDTFEPKSDKLYTRYAQWLAKELDCDLSIVQRMNSTDFRLVKR